MQYGDSDEDHNANSQQQNTKMATGQTTQHQNQDCNQIPGLELGSQYDQIPQKMFVEFNEFSKEEIQLNAKGKFFQQQQQNQDQQITGLTKNQNNKLNFLEGSLSILNESNMNIQNDSSQSTLDHYTLAFSEKHFNNLQNQEEYHLNVFNCIYDLVKKNQIKIYEQYPNLEESEAGMFFLFRRTSNSDLNKIIYGMKDSKFTENSKKRNVQKIGKQFAFAEGFLKFQNNSGIRVVKFAKENRNRSVQILNQTAFILIYLYERDKEDKNKTSIQKIVKNNFYTNQTDSDEIHSNDKMEQDESEISEKQLSPSLKKQQLKQNETKKSTDQFLQKCFQGIKRSKRDNQSKIQEI
ncbi:hypothetical protein ABPG72_003512 [Tetrahymena utriculariae]